ncbi:RagB/SusD family nutrient uptake outer membrane protein [Dyadobacter chenhuakuii]|uniref:RagB/SusD family nutrient uptake outer membrane protein n=1 Tax=Dyadobacter chenhuakuii TaxID=2909339 RepID=A0ABY4XN13_9BACT|nr:RagB/SusD family nutrient uptake outer membrane protein [Dyadobacter chenhuakuii]MCF2495071.1 RagB/SusD family nutrient uptake outer membrane protein [Dyadobacter chenhuakuii]USJ31616.1 RagB/SusD family nutrient uptake outer membrane protein [Dyadobacter chenhuakuii]
MTKYINKTWIIMLLLTFVNSACSDKFLEIPATGQLSVTQLNSKAGIEGLLVAAYAETNGRGFRRVTGTSNWLRGSISGGDANKGSNSGDYGDLIPFMTYQLYPSLFDIGQKWNAMYEGISRTNAVLRILPSASADVTDADKQRISAEARFLRAHYYFDLKRIFNMVPFIDETMTYGNGIEKVPNNTDIWPKIEEDLAYAYQNLPATQPLVGRANKWAAASYLAKTYLYQKKYQDAKTLFDEVIANGVTSGGLKYALVANYTDIFNAAKETNSESIFAIQAAANTGSTDNANTDLGLNYPYGSSAPGGCCGYFQPSFELANSFRVNAQGLPLVDGSYNMAANQLKTDQGIISDQPFTPDAGPVDPRLDWSVGRRGIPFLDWGVHPGYSWIRDQSFGGPYSPKKFIHYKSQVKNLSDATASTDTYSAINYNIIRYADVLLMAAEAEIEVGSLSKAQSYVNMVRQRAANKEAWVKTANGQNAANYNVSIYNAAWSDKTAARLAVQFERKLELSGEGHRFFDLVRWGTAQTVLNNFLTYEKTKLPVAYSGGNFTAGRDEYQPIPQTQIDYQGSDILKQNPNY